MGQQLSLAETMARMGDQLDLRRKREGDFSDTMVRRAHWLEPDDRELVLAMFQRDQSASEIALLSNEDPRNIRRRLKHLIARLNDPTVAYVVAHHKQWPRTRRAIARELYIRGRTMRQASERFRMSLHSVRKHRDAIETMCQAQGNDKRPSRTWRTAERGQP